MFCSPVAGRDSFRCSQDGIPEETSYVHTVAQHKEIKPLKNSSLKFLFITGCSLNIVFFPKIIEILPPLPRQHSAAIGCTKNYQPIGVTVHSHCVESFEGLLQRCRRGMGYSEL